LSHLGHDLDDANPYGGFLQPIIQPVSVLVVNILIWMHDQLKLAYGWVLITFGILVRLLLCRSISAPWSRASGCRRSRPLLKQSRIATRTSPSGCSAR